MFYCSDTELLYNNNNNNNNNNQEPTTPMPGLCNGILQIKIFLDEFLNKIWLA